MSNAYGRNRISATLALLAAGLLFGCQGNNSGQIRGENDFPVEGEHDNQAIIHVEEANGALADATLYPRHFNGDQLNSLGMKKLDLMLDGDPTLPMTVWLDIPEDDLAQSRRLAVGTYLEDRGLLVDQIKFGSGPNPDTYSVATDQLKGLALQESDTGDTTSGSNVSSTSGH